MVQQKEMGLGTEYASEGRGGFLGDFQVPNLGDRWIVAPSLSREEMELLSGRADGLSSGSGV